MKHIRFDWAIKKILRDKINFIILEGFLTELIGDGLIGKPIANLSKTASMKSVF